MKRLEGKTVLATASGAGIGLSTALRMRDEGAHVIATDINVESLIDIPGLDVRQLDATDSSAINELVANIGHVDVLFNCAGFVHNGTIMDMSDDDWDFSFTLNVRSQFRFIRAYLPGMLENKDGSIINMASVASSIKGAPNRCLYGSTKAAILGLTRAVAADYVSKGIRCNALCPGTIMTPSLEERMRATGDYENAKIEFLARQPIGRFATSEEVTGILIHLASDDSQFTTGTFQIVDGGWSL